MRLARILQRDGLPTGSPPLFRDLFLSLSPYASPRCAFGSDAESFQIGTGVDLAGLVFVDRGTHSLPPFLGDP